MAAATSKPCSRSIPRTSWISYQGSCISPNEAMNSQLETVWCFFVAVDHDHKLIYYILYIIYSYKWLFLTIPSLPSFSHPQGHWQFHRTKCDLNWPFDNFKSLSAEHQPPHRQLSSVPLLAWSTLLKLSAALRKSPVATQRNQAQDWLEKKSWPKCKRTIQTWIPSFWETSRIWNTVKDFNVH